MHTKFYSGNLRGRDHLEHINGRIILQWMLKKWDIKMWTGSIWARVGSSDGLFRIW